MTATGLMEIGALYREIDRRVLPRAQNDYDAGEQNAYLQVLVELQNRFRHLHAAGPEDVCTRCGLHLYDDIHKRSGT